MKYQFAFSYGNMEETISVNADTYNEALQKIHKMEAPINVDELQLFSIFELNNELSTTKFRGKQ